MNIITIKATVVAAPEPPFVGTEVVIRTTPEQLTWSVYVMTLKTDASTVDVDCGDGEVVTVAKGEKFIHTYARPGTYRIRVPDLIKSFAPCLKTATEYCEKYAPLVQSVRINTPSVIVLGAGNYKNCRNMTTLDIRNCQVALLSSEAFRDCHTLTSLDGLPPSATKIDALAFCSCRNVQGRVDFPNVNTILPTVSENAPFLDCPKITELHFPASAAAAITAHPLYPIAFGAENAAVFCDL